MQETTKQRVCKDDDDDGGDVSTWLCILCSWQKFSNNNASDNGNDKYDDCDYVECTR